MVEPLSSLIAVVPAILPSEGVAGSTAVNGAVLNLATYNADRVLIVVSFGAIVTAAVTSIKAQTDTAVGFSTPQDIAGSNQAVADDSDDKTFLIDIINPPEPFLRLAVSRATQNATVAAAYYLVYGSRTKPVSQPAAVALEVHRDKANGTA